MLRLRSLLAALAVFAITTCAAQTAWAGTYRVIYANFFGPSHPNSKAMEFFKEKVEKGSDGAIKVTIKPNNEAGGEEKIMELVKRGTLQIVQVGGLLKDDEPMIGAWEQPFIVDSWDHARKIFFHPEFKKFHGKYEEKTGAQIRGQIVNGFRQISSSYKIASMEDFKKMKIRVPLMETILKVFQALGTTPTPMPMTELYTALETKVVDGQDNPYSTVKNMGWWEVQPYELESRHIFSPTSVLVNKAFYEKLPDNLKKVFDDALTESMQYAWDLAEDDENECIAFLKEKGIVFTYPDEKFKKEMRDAMTSAYEWYDQNIPGSKEFRDFCASLK